MGFGIICAMAIGAMFLFYFDPSATSLGIAPPELMVGMIAVVVISVTYYIIDTFRLKKSQDWVKIRSKVTSVRKVTEGRRSKYQVNYTYNVNGTNFYGQSFSLNEEEVSAKRIKKVCKIPESIIDSRSANGRYIVAYYNPEMYGESVICPNAKSSVLVAQIPAYAVVFVCMYYITTLIIQIVEKNELGGVMGLLEKVIGA